MIAARLVLAGVLLAGCSMPLVRQIEHRFHAEQQVGRAEELARAGKYREAKTTYQAVVDQHPEDMAAERSLFGLARLSLASDNPERNYREAHEHFDRFVSRYPSSPRAPEARAWRDLLATLLAEQAERARWRQEAERRGRELQRASQAAERQRLEVEKATQAAERQRLEVEKVTQAAERQRLEVEKATQAAERVQESLERLKRLELEQRR